MWQVREMTRPSWRSRWAVITGLLAVIVLPVSACSGGGTPDKPNVITDKGTPYGDLLVPKLNASVSDKAVGVPVDEPVTISAEDGVLGAVTMVNEQGKTVEGELSEDGVTWSTTEQLGYNRQYTVTAQSLGLGGVTTREMTFETHSPANLTMPYVVPSPGEVVGIGQPVAVRFDENIPNRVAAERAIKVTTTPQVEGAFYWLNNREVRWRPATYWKPGTKVEVEVNTYGVDLGDGLFGQRNTKTHFTIGDEVITRIDDTTKTLTVKRNGEVIKSMPVSMGKDATPTNNGVYVVGDKRAHMVMDSSTYGVPVNSPDGYRTEVDWAVQMSYSGIYLHGAPWSVGSQGYSNVSHGCINVSTSNAKWFFDNSKRGDIIEVVNTVGSTLPGADGLGDWNIPWDTWKAGNADM